jgi:hypothetical protein
MLSIFEILLGLKRAGQLVNPLDTRLVKPNSKTPS